MKRKFLIVTVFVCHIFTKNRACHNPPFLRISQVWNAAAYLSVPDWVNGLISDEMRK